MFVSKINATTLNVKRWTGSDRIY